jgi:hypothetical protein
VEAIRQFLDTAAHDITVTENESANQREPNDGTPSSTESRRAKPLVALPLVGTGDAGMGHRAGEMAVHIIKALYQAVERQDIDVALVLIHEDSFAAAQSARAAFLQNEQRSPDQAWAGLNKCMLREAARLAEEARSQRLVLFLGAGVSDGAGLPDWTKFLESLAKDRFTKEESTGLTAISSSLDRARVIEKKYGSKSELGKRIAELLSAPRYSLAHGLLASLPVVEVATTNYDRLFEMASGDVGKPVAVLPWAHESVSDSKRWLVKLHGCVDHPDEIVLTREDYIRYRDNRSALIGIVHAMLLTRHLLFVGFSLNDDNFHQIIDDVHKVYERPSTGSAHRHFGTVLQLQEKKMWEALWKEELRFIDFGTEPADPQAKRQAEIFLDYLLYLATDAVLPILDPAYEALLSTGDLKLRERLWSLYQSAQDADISRTASWTLLEKIFGEFKGDYTGSRSTKRRNGPAESSRRSVTPKG